MDKLYLILALAALGLFYISVFLSLPDVIKQKEYRKISMMIVFPLIVFWALQDIDNKIKKKIVLIISLTGCGFCIGAFIIFYSV